MKNRIIDEEITLVPYFPNEDVTYQWYKDKDLCKQVDNIDYTYSIERLRAMYNYLSQNGECYYIEYLGNLVGDVSIRNNGEVAIVICKEHQNRHIGRRCVEAMIDLAKEKGMDKMKANIYSFNKQSQKMFLEVGFVQTESEWFEYML